jgi:hypothetical protein
MQNKNTENLSAFRDIVNVLIDNSLLLSFEEKANFKQLTPMLDMRELTELFRLLVDSKENSDKILNDLAEQYPEVAEELEKHNTKTIKNLFKAERNIFKTNIINQNSNVGNH